MRHLGLALFSEGPTDDRFLAPLLQRLCQDLCQRHSDHAVDIADDVVLLQTPRRDSGKPRAERVVQAAAEAAGAWQILFLHADGAGDAAASHARLVAPGLTLVEQRCGALGVGVAVVPIRETEAWALADGDALRFVFGTTLDDAALGVPARARQVESITDPKQALEAAHARTGPTGRHARAGAAASLSSLGQRVALTRLRQVPSFARTEADVMTAMRQLGIVGSPRE